MDLTDSAKSRAALGLSAILATAATNAGYSHCAWITQDGCLQITNGTGQPSEWQDIHFGAQQNPLQAFTQSPPQWRPYGIRILLSDLLWLGCDYECRAHYAHALRGGLGDDAADVKRDQGV